MRKILTCFFTLLICALLVVSGVRADELSDIQKQIDDLQKQLDSSKNTTSSLEGKVKGMDAQVLEISGKLSQIAKELDASERALVSQKQILAATVRNFYIRGFIDIPFLTFFSSGDATETLKLIAFQQTTSKEDKDVIHTISEKVAKLADDKKRLALAQAQLDRQRQALRGQIASPKSFPK